MGRRKVLFIVLLMGLLGCGLGDKKFIVVFMENFSFEANLHLHISSYDDPATVQVTVKEPNFKKTLTIEKNSTAIVSLSGLYMLSRNELSSKAVTVLSDKDITVVAFNSQAYTSDACAVLEEEDLGKEYYIFTPGAGSYNEYAVASSVDVTTEVKITVSGSFQFNGKDYGTGDTFSFSLEPKQVIHIQSFSEFTGTRVEASEPVAVYGGNRCYYGPNTTCDILYQQLFPVENWGKSFVVFPFLGHSDDFIDIVAARKDTVVKVGVVEYTLQPGSHQRLTVEESVVVTASEPVMVNYIFEERTDSASYDPFIVNVPPIQQRRRYYKFITEDTYDNYILVVSTESKADEFYLDRTPLDKYKPTEIEIDGYTGWEVHLSGGGGQHEIVNKFTPFFIYVFGLETRSSYGYSLGQETEYPDGPEIPLLNCLSNGADFYLPLDMVTEANLNVSDIHLEDPSCRGTEDDDYVYIKIPANKCGTKIVTEEDDIIYINTVFGTVPGTAVHRIEIPVQCKMDTDEGLKWGFGPEVTDMLSEGEYAIFLRLYRDEDFKDQITTYPYGIDMHSTLYVEFKLESDDAGLQLLVENCLAVPTLDDADRNYTILQKGCPVDSTLERNDYSDDRVERFNLHVFKFYRVGQVFLQCDVTICHNSSTPNRCTEGCVSKRPKRDVRSTKVELGSLKLSQGPFFVSPASANRVQSKTSVHTMPSSVAVGAIVVMGLLSVMGLVVHRRYKPCQKYTVMNNTP
ncbi:uncharacterized protein [Hyperolius riggenbachi]|uniref:uncharacterized protein isoform X2 n=1 Tax=Hyperolius riggenbachi TaxID=752182 RepID=UPI0035A2B947